MTEYDDSPEGRAQWQRTQERMAHWVNETGHFAPQFKSPFAPRSDVPQDNEPLAGSASPSHAAHTLIHSPLLSTPSPKNSRSPIHAHRSHRERDRDRDRGRARSHSPTRHTSSHRSSRRRSSSRGAYTIVPGASGATVQYAQAAHYEPAAYVVIARGDRRVQVVSLTASHIREPEREAWTQPQRGALAGVAPCLAGRYSHPGPEWERGEVGADIGLWKGPPE
ncbi:hypothetical protein B0H15DRAFT_931420 [Mycena belliarum]|uniref:Uncharacterized protein n=1 Tax=Mycena belliarum TaxID=1033014 RepID=A0AAD6U6J9_9AGAR|nr:hypothetical protein B0H15DRAFT_931420 [Mycena belliae]